VSGRVEFPGLRIIGSRQAAAPRRTLFEPEHVLTDTRLCLEEGQALGVPFPAAAHTREVLRAATGLGHADDDFAAMIEPLETAAGT
jgi:3-hydroxyisobutyrate dehydrogenase-like beta-hydroxyacid dehydrogenase